MADREVAIVDDVAGAAAERIAARVRAGGHIALSGGSTPKAAHQAVAAMGLDWSRTVLWFGDERAVGPEHEHSNYRMAKESLLDRIEGPRPAVHRIQGELGQHEAAAASCWPSSPWIRCTAGCGPSIRSSRLSLAIR